jgi:DNA polymerase bacteriophage-type
VNGFRAANPGIVRMWDRLNSAMQNHGLSSARAEPFVVELPSWRSLSYYDVNFAEGGMKARDEMGGLLTHWFGGKLFENLVQATSRDILIEAEHRIEQHVPGAIVLDVYDEVVCEVDMDVPESLIEHCMTVTPEWAPGLPVGSSVETADRYFK